MDFPFFRRETNDTAQRPGESLADWQKRLERIRKHQMKEHERNNRELERLRREVQRRSGDRGRPR